MRFSRLFSAWCVVSAVALPACGASSGPEAAAQSVSSAVRVNKSFTRKVYVHLMPWFQVGGSHWSMKTRNSATGVASWYKPLIGEYSSDDGNVIEYQLLTMKYAGIDGVIIDWPGLNGDYDRPKNKANSDAIIARTAAFGLEFGVCYEDQYAASLAAAKADMAYVRDHFFSKPNHILVNGAPGLLVFGPQTFKTAADWSDILSVFPSSPSFFQIWDNASAGSNADGKFGWIAQNGMKGVADFDAAGLDVGIKLPVLYPGFNPYYAEGGWPGPQWKVSYGLKPDNSEGGDTLTSTFELGKGAGEPLQIATWNDYGEGTMVEPTEQFQYQFLTTLQQLVGLSYTDAELKIVKMLFDQRRQNNASRAAKLDMASAALANLDLATACAVLGCEVPVHPGGNSGAAGAGGTTSAAGAGGAGGAGATTSASASGSGGDLSSTGGASPGSGGQSLGAGGELIAVGGMAPGLGNAGAGTSGGCGVSRGASQRGSMAPLIALGVLALAACRRQRI